ncbi:MAG: hypothetical protein EZS28_035502, partial [Streblomastix strix]
MLTILVFELCYPDTPFSEEPLSRLMARIAIGPSLNFINNMRITTRERVEAMIYGQFIRSFIFEGFLLRQLPCDEAQYFKINIVRVEEEEEGVCGFIDIVECEKDEAFQITETISSIRLDYKHKEQEKKDQINIEKKQRNEIIR